MSHIPKWASLLLYLCHVVIASYGVLLINSTIELAIGKMIGPQSRSLDYIFFGPTFIAPILLGLALGYRFGRSLTALSSRLIFLIPLVLVAYSVWISVKYGVPGESAVNNIKDNYLGAGCESSECLYEALVSAPLFSSIAYSAGAEIGRWLHRVKKRSTS
jgi:hypothetical protein